MAAGDEDEHDRTREIIAGERRAWPRPRTLVVMYVVLPMVVLMSVWVWIRYQRSKVRERGVTACLASGKDSAWCEAAADKNHDRCMELTYRPGTRMSGESFDEQGYVECLDIGAQAYWKASADRAAERRKQSKVKDR